VAVCGVKTQPAQVPEQPPSPELVVDVLDPGFCSQTYAEYKIRRASYIYKKRAYIHLGSTFVTNSRVGANKQRKEKKMALYSLFLTTLRLPMYRTFTTTHKITRTAGVRRVAGSKPSLNTLAHKC